MTVMARLGPEHGGYGSIKSSVGCSERGPVGCVGGEAIGGMVRGKRTVSATPSELRHVTGVPLEQY